MQVQERPTMPRCSCPSLEMLMLMLEQMTDQAGDQAQGCHAIDLRELKAAMRSLGFEVKNEGLMMSMATASPRFSL